MERGGALWVPDSLVLLGKGSYSIYLLHTIVIMVLQQIFLYTKQFIVMPDTLVFFVFVAVAVAISMEFSRYVEQPLLRYLQPKGTRRT